MESCHCPPPCSDSYHNNTPSTRLMLPSPLPLPLPLTFNFLHPKPPGFHLLTGASDAVRVAQKSIASNVHRFLDLLHKLRSQNALLERALSFPSYLHNCCQSRIQRREFQSMLTLSNGNFAAILPGDSLAGTVVANGILNFLNIYNTLLVVRLVLTWFPSAPPAIVSPLSTLCDPYLNIFRGIIPPLGGTLDLSPILAFLVLNAFTSTASALPAELPPSKDGNTIPLHTRDATPTSSQKKWLARLAHNKSEKPSAGI